MSSGPWKISGGTVYDPANGVDGEQRDVWFENGKIIGPPENQAAAKTVDASGLIVMPGGVDVHSHIAGSKPNAARLLTPERRDCGEVMHRTRCTRSGTLGPVPSTFATGQLYAGLGYTTAFDAAVAPLGARHAHHELEDTPCLDKGFFALIGNNQYAIESIQQGDRERLRRFIAWLLGAAKAYAPKLVNPGGVDAWKRTPQARSHGLDDKVVGYDVTPRAIVREIVAAANDLGLPHPAHIHCNQLGMPGNWLTTLETMRSLEGRRAHLAHVQFHSYGGEEESQFCSRAKELTDYVNEHDNITVDVGQVIFGDAMAMTGDGAAAY
ncbi:MAG: formylmethanofuran dehydrogenase subunit A, partial [Planctomycetota bacterium]